MDKSEFESRYFDLVSKAPGKTFLFYGNLKEDMIRWSASAVEYFGLPGEIFGDSTREWISRIHPEDVEPYTDSLMELLHGVTPYHNCEYRIKNAQGEYVWVNCRGYMTYDADGKAEWFGGLVTNMGYQTKIDAVTNLWTVHQFRSELNRLLDDRARGGILMIGLENFKRINAEYSYAYGDKVLALIGEKLREGVLHNCHVFRMDGANFAIVMQDAGVERIVEYKKFVDSFMRNLVVSGQVVHLRFKAAAAFFPEDGEFLDQIQSNLFYALDHAKLTNTDDVVFYSKELFAQKKYMTRLKEAIRECVEEDCKGFRIVMQPIVETKSEVCDAAEVLLRFTHPEFAVILMIRSAIPAMFGIRCDRTDGFYSDSGEFQGDHPGWKMGDRPIITDACQVAGADWTYAVKASADQCVLCTVQRSGALRLCCGTARSLSASA